MAITLVAVHGLPIEVAFLVADVGSRVWTSVVVAHGPSSCGSETLKHRLWGCGAQA